MLNRKDAGTELLAKYSGINRRVNNNFKSNKQKNALDYKQHERLHEIEILLAQYCILSGMTKIQRRDLLKEVFAGYQIEESSNYGTSDRVIKALLLARIMQEEKYSFFLREIQTNSDIGFFLVNSPLVPNRPILNGIFAQTQQFLSSFEKNY